MNHYQLNVASLCISAFGPKLDRIGAMQFLLRLALRDKDGAPFSSNAMAASLKRPVETMRRAAHDFVRSGLLHVDGARFRLAADVVNRSEIRPFLDSLLIEYAALASDCSNLDLGFSEPEAETSEQKRLEAALDISLASYELSEARLLNSTDLYVLAVITVSNASNITHNPDLATRFAYDDTVPPKELRVPVSARTIAARDGLSYSTIRRHLDRLVKSASIDEVAGGYLLNDRFMSNERTSALSREKIFYLRRVLMQASENAVEVGDQCQSRCAPGEPSPWADSKS